MRSMTGFGRAVCAEAQRSHTVEVRSVNHRFLDMKVRLPWPDPAVEAQVCDRVRARLFRGRVEVLVREPAALAGSWLLDHDRLAQLVARLSAAARALGLDERVRLEHLLTLLRNAPAEGPVESPEARWACIGPALDQALDALDRMRLAEGQALARDLGARAAHVRELGRRIRERAPRAVEELAGRLTERLTRLLQGLAEREPPERLAAAGAPDPQRVAQEIVLLADRTDVSEELTRLESHLAQFEDLLGEREGPVGRQLEFLLQELGREVNTVGSKAQDAVIAQAVVELKAELEKMREQVQNVE